MKLNLSYGDIEENNKKSRFKIILVICIILLIVGMAITTVYFYNDSITFKSFIDSHIFRKEISSENLKSILISDVNNQHITSYNKYIVIIEKGKIEGYTKLGKKEFETNININNPITESKSGFLVVAEKHGQKICCIKNNNVIWEKELEGEILSLHSNANGYVAVILKSTSHRSIIVVFDSNGKELFKTGLATTYAVDVDISNDNKYLAIAEFNPNGSMIQSNIKIISIEQAKDNPQESFTYIYNDTEESLIMNIKFQDKNRLICMYDDKIDVIYDNKCEKILDISSEDSLFVDIKLKNIILVAKRVYVGPFEVETEINLINTTNNKEKVYKINGIPKKIYTYDKKIAVDMGTEIQFINSSGWLIKKYNGTKEPIDIIIGNGIGGIVFRDKIEFLNL